MSFNAEDFIKLLAIYGKNFKLIASSIPSKVGIAVSGSLMKTIG